MIQTTKETKRNTLDVTSGTYIYALFAKEKVVHVGQCAQIQNCIDEHMTAGHISFDRFTYTYMAGIKPFSEASNLMELIASNRLMPQKEQAATAEQESYTDLSTGKVIYMPDQKSYGSRVVAPLLSELDSTVPSQLQADALQVAI